MGTIVKLNTVQEYNMAMGVETLHPLVSVVDFSTLKSLKHGRKNFWLLLCFSETAQVVGNCLMGAARTITRKARWYLWLLDKWQELMMTEKH